MNNRRLPAFIIDIKSTSVLDDLAQAIDHRGDELGITEVVLITPRMESANPLRSFTDKKARRVRLFTSEHGHFHGTQHNLKNNLTHSGQNGILVFTVTSGLERRSHFMALRPSAAYQWSARPMRPLKAIDGETAIRTVDQFIDTVNERLGKKAPARRVSQTVQDIVTKYRLPDDMGALLELMAVPLRPHGPATSNLDCKPA